MASLYQDGSSASKTGSSVSFRRLMRQHPSRAMSGTQGLAKARRRPGKEEPFATSSFASLRQASFFLTKVGSGLPAEQATIHVELVGKGSKRFLQLFRER